MRAKVVSIEHASGRGVAERYKSQYWHARDGWLKTVNGSSSDTYNRLCALGPTPSVSDVAEVIGNKSWSYILCRGCSTHVEKAVRLGREYDEELFCRECISEAAQILEETP